MDADEEDFVFFGTPIERAEEMTSRKKKAAAEASGNLRSLPVWKQEVTDEEGRRRFHGAFTGGFSAGYYNTVGSKEGWTPQSFTSSRKKRAEPKEQSIYSFMDEDEKAESRGRGLGTSLLFDTFGFTAAEVARRGAEKEVQQRPSAIPGPVPEELVVPAAESIGIKLLLKMGWRHGHAIKESQPSSLYDVRREARKAFLALSSNASKSPKDETDTIKFVHENDSEQDISDFRALLSQNLPVFVLHPKQDLHGLGYDPFKHAPEFRERKRQQAGDNNRRGSREAISMREKLFSSNSGKVAPGFGIGALEELDVEDEDIYASGFAFEETCIDDVEEPIKISTSKKLQLTEKEHSGLSGFKLASNSDYHIESNEMDARFKPPVIPPGFEPHHKFSAPLDVGGKFADPPPPEVPPPEDKNLKLLIEGFATLVRKCGKLFEDLSREKNKANPLFSFLTGGYGHEYYVRKLWEEQQKQSANKQQADDKSTLSNVTKKKLTAETRGKILGERPLERSSQEPSTSASGHLQVNLSDTFTAPLSLEGLPIDIKPFKDDPAKQERFEQFLKDKYQGGLRSTKIGGSNMSEVERARERLDFEAAAEAIEKGKWNRNFEQPLGMQFTLEGQFVSSALELSKPNAKTELPNIKYPRREEYQWRPSPILCKRFDIIDPFMGQPVPVSRARSRLDSMIIPSDFPKMVSAETVAGGNTDPVPHVEESYKEASAKEVEINDNPSVERPVDLYKAIFSDNSDDEDTDPQPNPKQGDTVEKRIEVANTTLNRLIAGDFLESLGKELGLEVPPDPLYYSTNKINTSSLEMETSTSASQIASKNVESKDTLQNYEHTSRVEKVDYHGNMLTTNIVEKASNNIPEDKSGDHAKNEKNDASKTQKRRHSNRSSSSDTDSSDDSRQESRSRREYERHSSRKSGSKHSKYREDEWNRPHNRSRRHRSEEESPRKRDRSKSRNGSEDRAGRSSRDDYSKSDHKKKHRR